MTSLNACNFLYLLTKVAALPFGAETPLLQSLVHNCGLLVLCQLWESWPVPQPCMSINPFRKFTGVETKHTQWLQHGKGIYLHLLTPAQQPILGSALSLCLLQSAAAHTP